MEELLISLLMLTAGGSAVGWAYNRLRRQAECLSRHRIYETSWARSGTRVAVRKNGLMFHVDVIGEHVLGSPMTEHLDAGDLARIVNYAHRRGEGTGS